MLLNARAHSWMHALNVLRWKPPCKQCPLYFLDSMHNPLCFIWSENTPSWFCSHVQCMFKNWTHFLWFVHFLPGSCHHGRCIWKRPSLHCWGKEGNGSAGVSERTSCKGNISSTACKHVHFFSVWFKFLFGSLIVRCCYLFLLINIHHLCMSKG